MGASKEATEELRKVREEFLELQAEANEMVAKFQRLARQVIAEAPSPIQDATRLRFTGRRYFFVFIKLAFQAFFKGSVAFEFKPRKSL